MTLGQLDAESIVDYDILVADWEREQQACAKCGRPMSVCGDPEVVWYPQRAICYADMATASVRAKYDQLHGSDAYERFHDGSFKVWSNKRTDGTPFAHDDGVSFWVSTEDLSPDDDFLQTGGE